MNKTDHDEFDEFKEYDFSKSKRATEVDHLNRLRAGKTRITLYLDDDVLETLRECADNAGHGYQEMINEALREYLNKISAPIVTHEERK